MGRLEEIEKYWPVLFPDEQRDTFLRDAVLIANRDIRFLLSEVHRLRAAIEKHKTKLVLWVSGGLPTTDIDDIDEELYKALEEEK
jgi:hypothetical protein